MSIEEKFFEVFEIEPLIKKGEYYFTSNMRFGEVQATEDIPYKINSDKILQLEELLPSFELQIEPAPADEKMYCYKSRGNIGKYAIDRKSALLEFFIEYSDIYFDRVKALFPVRERRFEPTKVDCTTYSIKS